MRIAIAGILNKPILKSSFGGTEDFTYLLTESLVKKNHDVTLFANSDSQTSAHLVSFSSSKDMNIVESGIEVRSLYHLLQSAEITKRSSKFDLIHNNYYDSYFLTPFSSCLECPMITTVHSNFWQYPHMKHFFLNSYRHGIDKFIFVSKNARNLAGNPKDSEVIYNGIDQNLYNFDLLYSGEYLFWMSRLTPKKGAKEAIETAIKTGRKLILSGFCPPVYKEYFDNHIANFLSKNITLMETLPFKEKLQHYRNAKAFMFPIQWEEPFGLVMIEAMACGTPVIAFARGSVPEIIKDGETGFIVNPSDDDIRGNWIVKKTGIDGLCEAVERIYSLPKAEYLQMRKNCRAHVEQNFTVERMVNNYEKVYEQILNRKSR